MACSLPGRLQGPPHPGGRAQGPAHELRHHRHGAGTDRSALSPSPRRSLSRLVAWRRCHRDTKRIAAESDRGRQRRGRVQGRGRCRGDGDGEMHGDGEREEGMAREGEDESCDTRTRGRDAERRMGGVECSYWPTCANSNGDNCSYPLGHKAEAAEGHEVAIAVVYSTYNHLELRASLRHLGVLIFLPMISARVAARPRTVAPCHKVRMHYVRSKL